MPASAWPYYAAACTSTGLIANTLSMPMWAMPSRAAACAGTEQAEVFSRCSSQRRHVVQPPPQALTSSCSCQILDLEAVPAEGPLHDGDRIQAAACGYLLLRLTTEARALHCE